MTILTHQSTLSILTSQLLENMSSKDLIYPLNTTFTTSNYATLIETIVSIIASLLIVLVVIQILKLCLLIALKMMINRTSMN